MGGRKTYSVKKIIGEMSGNSPERRNLRNAIKEKDPKKIADTTLDLYLKGKTPNNFSKTLDIFELVQEIQKKDIDSKNLKIELSNSWADRKKEKNIKDMPEFDHILIDSAIKVIRKMEGKK